MKKTKNPKQLLMDDLDRLVREIVFIRDEACVTCPIWLEIKPETHKPSPVMTPGHFITRGAKNIRWDLRNVYKQCRTCNYIHEQYPEVMAQYVLKVLGKEGFEKLVADGYKVKVSINETYLRELYTQLSEEKEKIQPTLSSYREAMRKNLGY